ncbi:MAG: MucR family transcriptional regulator [Alphaproteobacteria bacterium]
MERESSPKISREDVMRMTAQIVSAYVSHNEIPGSQIPDVIRSVYATLSSQKSGDAAAAQEPVKPAVSIRKSVTPDYIVCLEDGKKLKMLKRHLRTTYNLTPEEYRAKWGLPADYPMVAPNYAAQRSAFAKKIGLGRKRAGRGRRKSK